MGLANAQPDQISGKIFWEIMLNYLNIAIKVFPRGAFYFDFANLGIIADTAPTCQVRPNRLDVHPFEQATQAMGSLRIARNRT